MRTLEKWFGPIVLTAFLVVLAAGLQRVLTHQSQVIGAGASFPAPLYQRWIALYEREHHASIEYNHIGSTGGIEALTLRTVHFAGVDAPLTPLEIEQMKGEFVQLPVALGAVVLVYNLPEIEQTLVLDGGTIADIYLGEIIYWNDPRIQSLNSGARLPDQKIWVTHRAENSDTSLIFSDYLSAVSPRWAEEVGSTLQLEWPISHGSGVGNDGVAQQILSREGGIGYLEINYAKNAGLTYAQLINQAGNVVAPESENIQAAEENIGIDPGKGTINSLVNAPGEKSYPIISFSYILVYQDLTHYKETGSATELKDFLRWCLTDGQALVEDVHFTPLPEDLRQHALKTVEQLETGTKTETH